jgi:hypothetical protein
MSFLGNLFKAAVIGATGGLLIGGVALFGGFGAAIGVGSAAALGSYVLTSAVLSAATYTVSSLMAGDAPKYDLSSQISGQLITTRSPNEAMRVIYGETRVGGPILFIESAGEKNETIYMSIGLGRDAGFDSVSTRPKIMFVNDEPYSMSYTSSHAGYIVYEEKTDLITFELSQSSVNPAILSETEAASYRFQGLAVIHVKLKYDADAFPNGLPNLTFEVSGKNLYDPRTDTTAFSNNAALVIRDYLVNTQYGLGVRSSGATSEIDEQSFEDAADVCDEDVEVNAYTYQSAIVNSDDRFQMSATKFPGSKGTIVVTGTLTGTATGISAGTYYVRNPKILYKAGRIVGRTSAGFSCDLSLTEDGALVTLTEGTLTGLAFSFGTVYEKRYTINGAFKTEEQPQDILRKMLTACGGKLTYQGGKWILKVAKYYAPTVTLDENDIIGQISVQASQSRRDIFNAIKGLYSEPTESYQPFSFPAIINSTYETQDGEQIWKDVQFPFTTSAATCQRLSKIDLEKSRQQISVNVSCSIKNAFALAPGDTVQLTFDRYGWSSKVFEVLTWEFSIGSGDDGLVPVVNLQLRETASTIYDWSLAETRIDLAPNTNLPNPFVVNPPGLAIADTLIVNAEQVVTKLVVTVTGTNTFQELYEVQAKLSTNSTYINLGEATGNIFELTGAVDGATYNVRARSINAIGVRSAWVEGNHQVVGKTAPPQNVSGFSVNIVGAQAHLSWLPVTDLDLSHYRIRHSRLTSGATYANAIDIETKVPRPAVTTVVPAMTGTYFIKAVDKLGIQSLVAAQSVVLIDTIPNLNLVETITEDPSFAGAKTECFVNDSGLLVLDTAADFDDISGLFDDADGDFDGGGGTVSTEGEYLFANAVNLGAIYTSRVTAVLETQRVDYVDTFDSAKGLFDDREGLFDGDADEQGDVNVALYVRRTNDDPTGSPTWTDWREFVVGDYKGWGLEFKAVLTSNDANASPGVQNLRVTVDMPERSLSNGDIASGTAAGGYVVTFSNAFKVTPAIAITAQNLTSGDYYEIVLKSASGFTIRFKNSGGTVVDRTFDWVARGYGELIT